MTTSTTVLCTRPSTLDAGHAAIPTLSDEHARLLREVLLRAAAVDTVIDGQTWPHRELAALTEFLRATLLRQMSDEESLLYPHDATHAPFAELSAGHARLYQLSQRLEEMRDSRCSLHRLRVLLDDLITMLRMHLAAEQAVLDAVEAADVEVPAVATLNDRHARWRLAQGDGPVVIRLDALPTAFASRLCIERVLRLQPGEHAAIYSCNLAQLHDVCAWLKKFDGLRFAITTPSCPDQHRRVDVACRDSR